VLEQAAKVNALHSVPGSFESAKPLHSPSTIGVVWKVTSAALDDVEVGVGKDVGVNVVVVVCVVEHSQLAAVRSRLHTTR
jgi:hypothetical protein